MLPVLALVGGGMAIMLILAGLLVGDARRAALVLTADRRRGPGLRSCGAAPAADGDRADRPPGGLAGDHRPRGLVAWRGRRYLGVVTRVLNVASLALVIVSARLDRAVRPGPRLDRRGTRLHRPVVAPQAAGPTSTGSSSTATRRSGRAGWPMASRTRSSTSSRRAGSTSRRTATRTTSARRSRSWGRSAPSSSTGAATPRSSGRPT